MAKRITQKDFSAIEQYIKDEMETRKRLPYRKQHEDQWTEVDRQISMQQPKALTQSGSAQDWHNAIQLGMLADASEIITADTLRLVFPNDRNWFAPHADLGAGMDEEGNRVVDPEAQKIADGLLRSLMAQQHSDFGFRDRVKLAIKEALHHGSFVATVSREVLPMIYSGGRQSEIGAPGLIVHSMWNCFPDPSPWVQATDLFYRGSMIIRSYMPWGKFQKMGDWVNKERVTRKGAKNANDDLADDVELLTYYGDIYVDRTRSDPVDLPNYKVILANDVLVYAEPNDTPFPPVIYAGYEKQDVRDPYFVSPIIKRAPMHKLATSLANKYLDGVELHNEPPIFYDALDSHMAKSGGPQIFPGAKNATRSTGAVNQVVIGNPEVALKGLMWIQNHIERGTGTDAVRTGVAAGTEQTATEVVKQSQRSEVRTVDFVATLERQALRPFLYMQHAINLETLERYPFFNNEIHTPDFMVASKSDLPKSVHFDIVGSRGLLGEEQRTARMISAIEIVARIEPMAAIQKWNEIARQIWEDAGVKEPERFLVSESPEGPDPMMLQVQQQMAEMAAELQKAQFLREEMKAKDAAFKVAIDEAKATVSALTEQLKLERSAAQKSDMLADQERAIIEEQLQLAIKDANTQIRQLKEDFDLEVKALEQDYQQKMMKAEASLEQAKQSVAKQAQPQAETQDSTVPDAVKATAEAVSEMTRIMSEFKENQKKAQDVVFKYWKRRNPEIADVAADVMDVTTREQ